MENGEDIFAGIGVPNTARTRITSAKDWSEKQLKRMWVGLWSILGVSTTGGAVGGFLTSGVLTGILFAVAGIALTIIIIVVWSMLIARGTKKRLNL